jgi:hypothetical protein
VILAAALAAVLDAPAAGAGAPLVWHLVDGRVTPGESAGVSYAVGSLQKAWVLQAWASSHPDPSAAPPRLVCERSSRCWLAAGHGAVDLRRATALSCNTYFRRLAEETSEAARRAALIAAGFDVPGTLTPAEAIGLDAGGEHVTIAPARLLEAYSSLLRAPWSVRDELRREWLDGMRDAAENGTAAGIPLRGLLAKTGTVAALDGTPLRVSGWAVALDPAGRSGWLALLPRGTGAEAARALGAVVARERPSEPAKPSPAARARQTPTDARRVGLLEPGASVRIRLLVAFRGPEVHARNLSSTPLRCETPGHSARWIGPESVTPLAPGTRLEAGLWELDVPRFGLFRVVRGALERGAGGSVVLTAGLRDAVEGIVRGELPHASPELREELASAVLRFLARGARHGSEDLCDLSHCARFVGLGPEVSWPSPTRAVAVPRPPGLPPPIFEDASWERALDASRLPGPYAFTTHCGGAPLSPHAVWGLEDREAAPCPRHQGEGASARWRRTFKDADLTAVFGSSVISLAAVERDGVRKTVVTTGTPSEPVERVFLYDELHRLVAARLSWNALPSPPDGFERAAGGWTVSGRGSGHRVGLCLSP